MSAISETIMYFQKGGLVMYPLLLCSLTVVSISIERYLYYRANDSGNTFAACYCQQLAEKNIQEATKYASLSSGRCAQILSAASEKTTKELTAAYVENQAGIFIATLRNKLDYLSIIVTMSPLLGLLGTIVGMIGAFSIFNLEAGAPLAITGGIGEALIATASGLCVAILALIANSYFNHRMDNMITDMEQCFSALLEAKARSEAK